MPFNKDGSRKESALYKKSGFKMKSSPTKKGIFSNFFSSLGAKKTDMGELRNKQARSSKGVSEFQANTKKSRAESKAKTAKTAKKATVKQKSQDDVLTKNIKNTKQKGDYGSMSVNALVKLREKGNKDVQSTINAKLKKDPNKWD
tara:strand:+ start:117 stop:551 length:435 start_codon:yes stop_codon:yes gene_type:complete